MDAGLFWTVVGSVAGVGALGVGIAQLRRSGRDARPDPGPATASPALPGADVRGGQGVLVGPAGVQVNQFFPPALGPRPEGLAVVGELVYVIRSLSTAVGVRGDARTAQNAVVLARKAAADGAG